MARFSNDSLRLACVSALISHYTELLLKSSFENSLKAISKIKRESSIECKLIYWTDANLLVDDLKDHLKLTGINTILELRRNTPTFPELIHEPQKSDSEVYIFPHSLIEELGIDEILKDQCFSHLNQRIFLLSAMSSENQSDAKELPPCFLDFGLQEHYFFSFFLLLKKILPDLDINRIIAEAYTGPYQYAGGWFYLCRSKEREVGN